MNIEHRTRSGDSLVIRAPAKVNLCLEVLGRRSNGYHDIRSVSVPVSMFDTLTLSRAPRGVEICVEAGVMEPGEWGSGDFSDFGDWSLPASNDNLVTRAALLLKKAAGYQGGASMRLEKRIPVAGGLGGGSSDAAAALRGLNALWETGLSRDRLMELGAELGYDVPAAVHGGAVLMEGLGEKVSPIECGAEARMWIVLANPGICVSTGDIYGRHRGSLTSVANPVTRLLSALRLGDASLAAGCLCNSLDATVFRKYPLVRIVSEALRRAGSPAVLVSGSGATVFGLAHGPDHARSLVGRLPGTLDFPVWCRAAEILPDGVMAAHGPLEA